MEIKLIKRELKNGRTSLVLEYYLGYPLGANGTTRPKRKFETLEYFLYGKHGKIDPVGTDEIDPVKTA